MTRKQRVAKTARRVTVYLTPLEEFVLQVIELRRRERQELRDSPSEIVSDALWKFLNDEEKVSRELLEALRPELATSDKSNVTQFPKKGKEPKK